MEPYQPKDKTAAELVTMKQIEEQKAFVRRYVAFQLSKEQ